MFCYEIYFDVESVLVDVASNGIDSERGNSHKVPTKVPKEGKTLENDSDALSCCSSKGCPEPGTPDLDEWAFHV